MEQAIILEWVDGHLKLLMRESEDEWSAYNRTSDGWEFDKTIYEFKLKEFVDSADFVYDVRQKEQ